MGLVGRESDVINGAYGNVWDRPEDNGGLSAPTAGTGPLRDLTVKIDVDVSEALTGLKALRREADAATRALKALDEALGGRNLRHMRGER